MTDTYRQHIRLDFGPRLSSQLASLNFEPVAWTNLLYVPLAGQRAAEHARRSLCNAQYCLRPLGSSRCHIAWYWLRTSRHVRPQCPVTVCFVSGPKHFSQFFFCNLSDRRVIEAQLHSEELVDHIYIEPLCFFHFDSEQRWAWLSAATHWNTTASVRNTDKCSKVSQVRIYSDVQHRNRVCFFFFCCEKSSSYTANT